MINLESVVKFGSIFLEGENIRKDQFKIIKSNTKLKILFDMHIKFKRVYLPAVELIINLGFIDIIVDILFADIIYSGKLLTADAVVEIDDDFA